MRRFTVTVAIVLGWAGPVLAQGTFNASADAASEPRTVAADTGTAGSGESGTPQLARPIAEAAENVYLRRAEARPRRPSMLVGLYSTMSVLNVLDVYSTTRALDSGAREANPLVARTAGSFGSSLAIKAATTATSIYFAEKLWKKNRVAAIVTMVAVNAGTAAIVARNFRNVPRR
jgi:hypothetical protein